MIIALIAAEPLTILASLDASLNNNKQIMNMDKGRKNYMSPEHLMEELDKLQEEYEWAYHQWDMYGGGDGERAKRLYQRKKMLSIQVNICAKRKLIDKNRWWKKMHERWGWESAFRTYKNALPDEVWEDAFAWDPVGMDEEFIFDD